MTELGVTAHTVLTATSPFDLGCSLRAITSFQPCVRDHTVKDGRVRRAFTHPTDPASAVVTEITDRDDGSPGVALTVFSAAPLTPDELAVVGERVSAWLSLDDDRAEFLGIAAADEKVRPLLAIAGGLHQVRFSSLAEGAAYFTLVQNSAQWFAALSKRRMSVYLGPSGDVEGETHIAFPDLSTLTDMAREDLLPFAGTPQRAARLESVLTGVATLDEQLLRTGPYEDAMAALLSVRGVGPFTAHALLLRALGRPDAVPLELEQFTNTAATVYGDPVPAPAELRARYGRWIGWWAYTCRTALGWLEQEAKAREKAERRRSRPSHPRPRRRPRPRTLAGRPHPADGRPSMWTPSDVGRSAREPDGLGAESPALDTAAGPGDAAGRSMEEATAL
jgi:DNA-3-methyladenine glycosylase II